jgi:arginase
MQVAVIQVPYMIGDERHGASKGPARYLDAGLERLLADVGLTTSTQRIDSPEPFRDSASASRIVNTQLQEAVRGAIGQQQLPLILAGSCDVSMGVLAAFDHSQCGVVWIDAHADFNTPESTVSGFFAGMALAVISGHCYRSLWAQIGDSTAIPEAAIVLLGVRDLSPVAERERLAASGIQVVGWQDGKPERDVGPVLDELASRVREVYLHIDMDALDPREAPGVVDEPVPGGLSLEQLKQTTRAVCARFRVRAATVATFNPDRDPEGITLRTGLALIETVARTCASIDKQ